MDTLQAVVIVMMVMELCILQTLMKMLLDCAMERMMTAMAR